MNNKKTSDLQLKNEDETIDYILNGRLRILQKKRGYRFSIDALLLTHFAQLNRNDRVLDIGAGSGVISLVLAYRYNDVKITGLEIQQELADMARRSIELNGLEDRVEVFLGDARMTKNIFEPHSFDVAVFNPPYRKLNSGRINPHGEKAVARHEIKGSLNDFLVSSRNILKDGGVAYIIYPAARGVELLFRMRENLIEPKKLRMVHSNPSSKAEFILVEGVKRGGEELKVLRPLFIYGHEGRYTEEVENIFKEIPVPVSSSL